MLVEAAGPSARRAVRLVFAGEPEAAPDLSSGCTLQGVRLIPLADLIRMKLTSFRAKDEAHLKDLDQAGLITAGDRRQSFQRAVRTTESSQSS
jgi:hypothetical protein